MRQALPLAVVDGSNEKWLGAVAKTSRQPARSCRCGRERRDRASRSTIGVLERSPIEQLIYVLGLTARRQSPAILHDACATSSPTQRRSPKTVSSTSPIPGTSSTRSTPAPATSAASCGAWTPSRIARCAPAARRCRATSSSLVPAVRQLAAHHRDRQGNRQGGLGNLVLGHPGRDLHGSAACCVHSH
jgi:hypothetical protein